jgi:hypothetical protein
MLEREMEDLIWEYPERLLNEALAPFRRQHRTAVGRSDLVFKDKGGRFLIVEIKRGGLERGAMFQVDDYFGALKVEFGEISVRKMVVANSIAPERQKACEQYQIECREVSENALRHIANEVGYVFLSERRGSAPACPDPIPAGRTIVSRSRKAAPSVRRSTAPDVLSLEDVAKLGFGASVEVVRGCMRIVNEINPTLECQATKSKDRQPRYFATLVRHGRALYSAVQGDEQPIRWELRRGGDLKTSIRLRDDKERNSWDKKLDSVRLMPRPLPQRPSNV